MSKSRSTLRKIYVFLVFFVVVQYLKNKVAVITENSSFLQSARIKNDKHERQNKFLLRIIAKYNLLLSN